MPTSTHRACNYSGTLNSSSFQAMVLEAVMTGEASGRTVFGHFVDVNKMIEFGSGSHIEVDEVISVRFATQGVKESLTTARHARELIDGTPTDKDSLLVRKASIANHACRVCAQENWPRAVAKKEIQLPRHLKSGLPSIEEIEAELLPVVGNEMKKKGSKE